MLQEAFKNDISARLRFAALHDCETKWKQCGKPSNKPLWACGGAFASCCRMDYADKGLEAPDANAIKEELSRNSHSQAALKTPKPS